MKKLFVIPLLVLLSCNNQGSSDTEKKDSAMNTQVTPASGNQINNSKAEELKIAMRKLWEDHITWTRNVILCLADNLTGSDQAVKRLLKNQDDIGDAIKPYYGDDAGKKLTGLL